MNDSQLRQMTVRLAAADIRWLGSIGGRGDQVPAQGTPRSTAPGTSTEAMHTHPTGVLRRRFAAHRRRDIDPNQVEIAGRANCTRLTLEVLDC
jgi:hypothetical protein